MLSKLLFWRQIMSQPILSSLEAQLSNGKNFVSIYWDYENINKIDNNSVKQLINFAQHRGYLVNKKAYAKASIWQHCKSNKEALTQLGFDCIDVDSMAKNAVDFGLMWDCGEEVHTNVSTNVFILITSDGDYETLVCKLQNKGKKVIVFYHSDRVSQALIKIADAAYPVEKMTELVENRTQSLDVLNQITYKDAIKCLLQAIEVRARQGKPTKYPTIDRLMRQNKQFLNYQGVSSIRKPDGTTFSQFSKFVEMVKAEGKVQVRSIGKEKELFLIEKEILVA